MPASHDRRGSYLAGPHSGPYGLRPTTRAVHTLLVRTADPTGCVPRHARFTPCWSAQRTLRATPFGVGWRGIRRLWGGQLFRLRGALVWGHVAAHLLDVFFDELPPVFQDVVGQFVRTEEELVGERPIAAGNGNLPDVL